MLILGSVSLPTGNKTVDFILILLFFVFGFYCGLDWTFRYPIRARKWIAEGKTMATEKTVRWMIRGGICMLVLCPIAIAFNVFLYFTGRW
jgi:hypothetical protein